MDSVFKNLKVILAHCLTNEGGSGNTFSTGKNLYQRIDEVLLRKPELSCSTITDGDTLLAQSNFFGPIGIILKNTRITFVSEMDAGTSVRVYGSRDYIMDDINSPTEINIHRAITNRHPKGYNELCTDGYDCFGFFLCFDDMPYLNRSIGSERDFYLATKKHNIPYFNMSRGQLTRAKFDQTRSCFVSEVRISTDNIYD